MKKITDLKEGDLIRIEEAAKLLKISEDTLRLWRSKAPQNPDKYPRSAKIGGIVFFLKSDLIDRLNREFNKAS